MGKNIFLNTTMLGTAAAVALAPFGSFANPNNGTVVGGNATISQNGKTLTIQQSSQKAIIDWNSFDIEADEFTHFEQASSSAIALNRIKDVKPSKIDGSLTATGNIILINPNGIVFGKTARVDVNSLVATTSDIDNDTFMNSQRLQFNQSGNLDAAIINEGMITAKQAGLVGLIAPTVKNSGTITAKLGQVALASGDGFTLDMAGDGLTTITATGDLQRQLVENSGTIDAEGGVIQLTAMAARNAVENLVTNSGTLKANSFTQKGGSIYLFASGSNGKIAHSGSADVSGTTGGIVDMHAGNEVRMVGGTINAQGDFGGGVVRLGGDFQGKGNTLHANYTLVDANSSIFADALQNGNGGEVILWSNGTTDFAGLISAKGGALSGDGGLVETSGKQYLNTTGLVRASATNGKAGTWLLDPADIVISNGATTAGGNPNFVPTGTASVVNVTDIVNALNAGTNVTITTGGDAFAGNGDITVNNAITATSGTASLTLSAYRNITINAAITTRGDLILGAANSGNGIGYIYSSFGLTTNGGNFVAGGGLNPLTGHAVGNNNNGTQYGVYIGNTINVGAGTVTVNGTSGNSAVGNNMGVNLAGQITASAVNVTGISQGTNGNNNHGVQYGSHVLLTGAGNFFTDGTVGTGTSYGVNFGNLFATYGNSAGYSGAITVNANNSVFQQTGTMQTTGTFTLNNATNITGNGHLYFAGGLTFSNSVGNIATGVISTSGGALSLTSVGSITTSHLTTSNGAVTLLANVGNLTTGNITTTNGTITTESVTGAATHGDISTSNAAGNNIQIRAATNISTGGINGYNITLNADRDANQTGWIRVAGNVTSNGGAIVMGGGLDPTTGMAYGENINGYQYGIRTYANLTTSGGSLTMNGTGGAYASGTNYGVIMNTGTTNGAVVSINGVGGSAGNNNYGVYIQSSLYSTSGSGAYTLTGTAGSGTGAYGVYLGNIFAVNGGNGTFSGNVTINSTGTDGFYNEATLQTTGTLALGGGMTNIVGNGDYYFSGAMNFTGTTGSIVMKRISTSNGAVSLTSNTGGVTTGAITTTNGAVTILATGGNAAINGLITTTNGGVTITAGSGYASVNGAVTTSNAASPVSITATDYVLINGAINGSSVVLNSDSDSSGAGHINVNGTITSNGGAITLGGGSNPLTGFAVGSSSHSSGIYVAGSLTSGGGNITLHGRGGTAAGGSNIGVYVNGNTNGSGTGNIIIVGEGGSVGNTNSGTYTGHVLHTGSGSISISGLVGAGTGGYGINLPNSAVGGGSGSGNISLAADSINFNAAQTIQTSGSIYIKGYSAGTDISFGSGSTGLALSDAFLGYLTWGNAGKLYIGDSTTGTVYINSGRTFTKRVEFISGASGDISLLANLTSSIGAGNDAFVLASGRNFLNAGSFTINPGSGRWIGYSTSAAGDTNPLTSPQVIYGETYYTLAPGAIVPATYNGTQNTWVYSASPNNVTFTALNQTITYGGLPDLVALLNGTYSFACSTGCTSSVITTAPTLSITGGTGLSSAGHRNVGSWTISINGAAVNNGHTVNYVAGTLTIDPRALTVTGITANNKTYDATTTATLNTGSAAFSGVLTGDTVTIGVGGASGTFANANVGTGKTVTVAGVTKGGADAGNYTFSQPTTTADITAATLNVTADAQSRVYGAANPALTYTYAGFQGADNASLFSGALTTSATVTSNVGAYGITVGTLAAGGNYTINYTSANLTITKAPLTITANNDTRRYGAADPAFTSTYTGFVNGDTASAVTGLQYSTNATNNSPVGGGYIISPFGATSTNYNLTYVDGALTITRGLITITPTNTARLFGQSNPTFTGTVTGLATGDTIDVAYDTNATDDSGVGIYNITTSVTDPFGVLGNYDLVENTGQFTILQGAVVQPPSEEDNQDVDETGSGIDFILSNCSIYNDKASTKCKGRALGTIRVSFGS